MSVKLRSRLVIFFLLCLTFNASAAWRSDASPSPRYSKKKSDRESQLRSEIIGYAQNFIGSRYKYAGRNPQTGFDCSGFTCFVMKNFEIAISPCSVEQARQGKTITVKETKPGDLIFFRRKKGGRISHVAMVVDNDEDGLKIIHSTSRGVVIDDLFRSKYWKPKVAHARDVISAFAN